jgi:hypothetical protein
MPFHYVGLFQPAFNKVGREGGGRWSKICFPRPLTTALMSVQRQNWQTTFSSTFGNPVKRSEFDAKIFSSTKNIFQDYKNVEVTFAYGSSRLALKEQYYTYSRMDLVSDIGGYLGLLLGHSVLSCFEQAHIHFTRLMKHFWSTVLTSKTHVHSWSIMTYIWVPCSLYFNNVSYLLKQEHITCIGLYKNSNSHQNKSCNPYFRWLFIIYLSFILSKHSGKCNLPFRLNFIFTARGS